MVDSIGEEVTEIQADVLELKILVESGVGGGGGGGLIIVDNKDILDAINVPRGTIASVASEAETEMETPLSKMYDYIADGGDPMGEVQFNDLDRMIDVECKFPNIPSWPNGLVVIGSKSGGSDSVFNLSVDDTMVRFIHVEDGKASVLILAEISDGIMAVYDDKVSEMHSFLRGFSDLCYYGIAEGSISDMSQFFSIIQKGIEANAYILGETWQRLMKDGEMPEIDLSALAQKADLDALTEAVVENEEATAAALNDLDKRVKESATKEDIQTINEAFANYPTKTEIAESLESLTTYVDEAIAEAITNTLNTAV
jgi:hypothetical protein